MYSFLILNQAFSINQNVLFTLGRMIETSLTLDVVYIAQKCKLDLSWYDRSKSNFRKIPVLD